MPIYEYRCEACRHQFDQLVRSFASKDPVLCPECGSGQVQRRPSVFAARQGESSAPSSLPGPCANCHDPQGPCPLRS